MKVEQTFNTHIASSRIAACSWTLRAESPHHLLQRLGQLQISAVQVDLSQVINEPDEWGDVIDHLRSGGIWVVSGMMALMGEDAVTNRFAFSQTNGILADHDWYTRRFHAEKIARLAERAGIELVSTQIGPVPQDSTGPEWAKFIDRLGAVSEIFANYGVKLAIETGQAPAELVDLAMDQLNLSNLGVNFDPAGFILAKLGDPIEALRRLGPRVLQAHVRDALPAKEGIGVGREVAIGNGAVDWNAFFELSTAIRPPIHFVIERDSRLAHDEDIAAARDFIAYHLAPKRLPNQR